MKVLHLSDALLSCPAVFHQLQHSALSDRDDEHGVSLVALLRDDLVARIPPYQRSLGESNVLVVPPPSYELHLLQHPELIRRVAFLHSSEQALVLAVVNEVELALLGGLDRGGPRQAQRVRRKARGRLQLATKTNGARSPVAG